MSEAEDFFEERALALAKEAASAAGTYRYAVCVGESVFYCDKYQEQEWGDRTRLILTDAWVHDSEEPNRFLSQVIIVCRSFNISERLK
jgi:hypothetical protein